MKRICVSLRLPWYCAVRVDSTYLTGKRVFIFGATPPP